MSWSGWPPARPRGAWRPLRGDAPVTWIGTAATAGRRLRARPCDPSTTGSGSTPTLGRYADTVRRAGVAIAAGTLKKVVLGRWATVHTDPPLSADQLTRRLRQLHPDATVFSVPLAEGAGAPVPARRQPGVADLAPGPQHRVHPAGRHGAAAPRSRPGPGRRRPTAGLGQESRGARLRRPAHRRAAPAAVQPAAGARAAAAGHRHRVAPGDPDHGTAARRPRTGQRAAPGAAAAPDPGHRRGADGGRAATDRRTRGRRPRAVHRLRRLDGRRRRRRGRGHHPGRRAGRGRPAVVRGRRDRGRIGRRRGGRRDRRQAGHRADRGGWCDEPRDCRPARRWPTRRPGRRSSGIATAGWATGCRRPSTDGCGPGRASTPAGWP